MFLIYGEQQRLAVCMDRALRKIFGSRESSDRWLKEIA
jgi:hypothetical protein